MITTNSRIEDKKPSGLILLPQLKTVGRQTRNCKNKGKATKSKQQCPWESILAKGKERLPRPEHSHGYVPSKPTFS
ncbi:hypothetical protein Tco_0920836 [Tanacetum coccineum]